MSQPQAGQPDPVDPKTRSQFAASDDPGAPSSWGVAPGWSPETRPRGRDEATPPPLLPPPPPGTGGPAVVGSSELLASMSVGDEPEPGQVLFGRYRVERQLGSGGMGSVWLVRHAELDAERALKLISPAIATDPQVRARFLREARVMARLDHPNAVAVHDARLAKDSAFIEMEYIRGKSLNALLRPGRPMDLEWVSHVVEPLCDVLQVAHVLEVVHRDLKPSNLMLVDGRPPGRNLKVLDFGIAKIRQDDSLDDGLRTLPGCFLGTTYYSSPEQCRGAESSTAGATCTPWAS